MERKKRQKGGKWTGKYTNVLKKTMRPRDGQ